MIDYGVISAIIKAQTARKAAECRLIEKEGLGAIFNPCAQGIPNEKIENDPRVKAMDAIMNECIEHYAYHLHSVDGYSGLPAEHYGLDRPYFREVVNHYSVPFNVLSEYTGKRVPDSSMERTMIEMGVWKKE